MVFNEKWTPDIRNVVFQRLLAKWAVEYLLHPLMHPPRHL